MSRFQSLCEKRFHLAQNQTNLHTEVLAGLTTFATMSYVLATIPNMLSNAGLPKGAVLTALILLVMSCSIAMAVYTNRPFCLAPGMSSVAILSAVDTTGMTAEVAFGVIFIEGVIFVLISFIGLRRIVVNAIPTSVKISISAGIGLFIALIGLKSGGIIITSDNDTLVLGDLTTPTALLFVIGFVVLLFLEARNFRGSMIVSILIVTLLGIPLGVTAVPESMFLMPASVRPVMLRIDIAGALNVKYFPWLFAFFVPDFFGTMGIMLGIGNRAGWLDENGNMPDIEKCFKVDSLSTVAGSLFCMPVMTTYLESVSGVEDGGRTGLTSIVTSVLFGLMLLFTPLALMIPPVATGPVLAYIGMQMLGSMKNINYEDKTEYIPAFMAVAMTIFTNSIATGLSLSVISYVFLKLAAGRAKEIHVAMYGLCIFLIYYLTTLL